MVKIWDNDNLKKLKNLVEKGLSTSDIGRKLGFSKNAIVGKLNRLGWNKKAQEENKNAEMKIKQVRKASKMTIKSEVKDFIKNDIDVHDNIIKHALEMAKLKADECRWAIGDPNADDFHFCRKKVFEGKPYCYEHCKIAYQFNQTKKKHE